MRLKALIFDVDGTLADTEEAHRIAFNDAFAAAGRAAIERLRAACANEMEATT